MPCCRPSDYNHQSFWHWPWTRGEAGHPHTGVDIFGKVGTKVVSQTGGIVLFAGEYGGKTGNFQNEGTCNPPAWFNWRLMFWLDPADHLPSK